MSLVFKTPLNAKNTTTRGSQNIYGSSGCNLVEGSAEYNENGEYTLEPEEADGFSSVAITVDVPSDVNNQSKTVTISENGESTVTFDEDYTGLASVAITVDVEPDLEAKTATYTANDTYTISPSQGKDGISEATVTVNVDVVTPYNNGYSAGEAAQKAKLESATFVSNGTYTKEDGYNSVTVNVPSDIHNQEKSATPTTSSQEITADSGYSGLSKVTVSAVTAAIDANISAGNIKKDVQILGVTGNYDPQPDLEAKTVNSSTVQQVITPTAGKDGLSSVTVEPYVLQAKTATPSTSQQVIEPDNDKDGLSSVTVSAVTSSIDANISAGNIKKDITILGVTGNYDPQPNLDSVNVTPTTSAQQITPSSPVDGYNEINVAAVTAAIDANIAAGNIKEGVTILGVQGTVHEGITPTGNINITDTTSTDVTNYATAQVVDANLAAGNIKSGVTILGVAGSYSPTVSLQNKTATPTTSQQVISADSGYDGLDEVTVSAVTSAIDANIVAGNIKDGVTILGVTGDYTGGGTNVPDWSLIGYTSQDLDWLTDQVAYSKTIKDQADLGGVVNVRGDTKVTFIASGGKYEYDSGVGAFNNCVSLLQVKDITLKSRMYNFDFGYVFQYCESLRKVGNITFKTQEGVSGNPTSLSNMFYECRSLVSIPSLDYSSCTDFSSFITGASTLRRGNLQSIPLMNMQSAQRVDQMFNMPQPNLTNDVAGFQYLGKAFTGTNATRHTLDLQYMQNLTKTAVMNIINNLSSPDDTTCTDATLKLYSTVYALLDASDIAIATAKNWSVVSA